MTTAIGFDLGTANLGWAVIETLDDGQGRVSGLTAKAAGVIHTHPDASYGRKTHDDLRRLREIHYACVALVKQHAPSVIGYESYAVFDAKENDDLREASRKMVGIFGNASKASMSPEQLRAALTGELFGKLLEQVSKMHDILQKMSATRGRGDAAKVLAVQGIISGIAFERHLGLRPFTPADLKRRAVGRTAATKEAVADRLCSMISGLEAAVSASTAPTHRSHAYDAAGHAMLALENL